MNCVNNCLVMSNTLDAQEIALERLKNVLIIFEKKKRNLDKRKNKLDEYKKKKDLNEDQQMAVSKYQEVVSNLELVDELNSLALQQIKDAEKTLKKVKKQEKLDNKRHEASLIEFVMRTYHLLNRVVHHDKVQSRLLVENVVDESELNILKELFNDIDTSATGNWKKCSEQLQSIYEGGSKSIDLANASDDQSMVRSISKDVMLKIIEKISNIDWLGSNSWEKFLDIKSESVIIENTEEIEETRTIDDMLNLPIENQDVHLSNIPTKEVETANEKLPMVVQPEAPKLSFVFLHESLVQDEAAAARTSENGYESSGGGQFHDDQDLNSRSGGVTNTINNSAWHCSIDDGMETSNKTVEDVFSSATQSEFMHSENNRNMRMRGQRQPSNGSRFRTRGASQAPNRDAPTETTNYWKSGNRSDNSGGSFNSNSRYSRSSGRGRPRGRGGSNRQPNEELMASMQ